MKKLLIFIILLCCVVSVQSQITPYVSKAIGTSKNLVNAGGALKAAHGIIAGPFADTTAANNKPIKSYNGAQIITVTPFCLWLRKTLSGGTGIWIAQLTDSTNKFLVNNIYKKVGTDSIFKQIGSLSTFAFKDSSGGSSGTTFTTQTHTSGSTVTVGNTANWLIVNPGSLLATLTITLPATPVDRQEITLTFGGTITGGNNVVTTLSIAPNTGQTITQNFAPTSMTSGESITYKYNLSTTKWYAK